MIEKQKLEEFAFLWKNKDEYCLLKDDKGELSIFNMKECETLIIEDDALWHEVKKRMKEEGVKILADKDVSVLDAMSQFED